MSPQATWGGQSSSPKSGRIAVTDAYFTVPQFEQGKAIPRIRFVLAGEVTDMETNRKFDWSFDWMTNGLPSEPSPVMVQQGERSNEVRMFTATGQEVTDATGFSDRADVSRFFASCVEAGVPLEERNMWPFKADGWAGLILDIEDTVIRTYDKKDADGNVIEKDKEVRIPLCKAYVGTFEVGGAVPVQAAAVTQSAPSTNGGQAASNGSPLTVADAISIGSAHKGQYVNFVEAVMAASKERGHPIAFNDALVSQSGEAWTKVNA